MGSTPNTATHNPESLTSSQKLDPKNSLAEFAIASGSGQHTTATPYTGPGETPITTSDVSLLNPSEAFFLGQPYDYQTPYRGDPTTVAELAEREGDDQVVFTEIFPGVYADRTENPLLPVLDPETGEPQVNPDTGETVMARQPYKDADGTVIDYEKKQVTLLDGYIVDLEKYSGLFNDTKTYDLSPSHIGEFALSGPNMGVTA